MAKKGTTKREAAPPVDIRKSLAKGELAPIYFLYGDERFLIDETIDAIRAAALQPGEEEFNLDLLSGSDVDANDILRVATMFPMMGARRLVIVREFDKVAEKERLVPFIERPAASTVLVLAGETADRRFAIYKQLEKLAVSIEFNPLRDYQIPDWIRGRLESRKKSINPDALQLMQLYSDRSLRDIQNEVDKLCLFVGERTTVTIDDVNAIVGVTREYNSFELQKALGERNIAKAMEILDWMLDTGEAAVGIVAGLTKYYQKLWVVQDMRRRGRPVAEIAQFLKLNPNYTKFIEEYMHAAAKVPDARFDSIFKTLKNTDISLKTSGMDARTAMTILIAQMAGQ